MEDVEAVCRLGAHTVRIGLVGTGDDVIHGGFSIRGVAESAEQLAMLARVLDMLESFDVDAIIAVPNSVATPSVWRWLAFLCTSRPNVIGHGLTNELFTCRGRHSSQPGALLESLASHEKQTKGSLRYISDVVRSCHARGMSCLLYAFRERSSTAMNYKLGQDLHNTAALPAAALCHSRSGADVA
jgi:hypothetical protein